MTTSSVAGIFNTSPASISIKPAYLSAGELRHAQQRKHDASFCETDYTWAMI